MGQFNSYGDFNKVTDRSLAIRYAVTPKLIDKVVSFEVTRYATKTYAYIGMTRAAALRCRDDKIAKYTRRVLNGETGEPAACQATVSVTSEGKLYTVAIDVNETDTLYLPSLDSDPAEIFAARLGSLDYDEAFLGLRIDSVKLQNDGRIRLLYSFGPDCEINEGNVNLVAFEASRAGGAFGEVRVNVIDATTREAFFLSDVVHVGDVMRMSFGVVRSNEKEVTNV